MLQLANLVTLRILDHVALCITLLRVIAAPSLSRLTVGARATTDLLGNLIGPFVDSIPTLSEKQVDAVVVCYEDHMITVHAASGGTDNIWEDRFLSITMHLDLPSDVVADGDLRESCLAGAAGALLRMPLLHTGPICRLYLSLYWLMFHQRPGVKFCIALLRLPRWNLVLILLIS